MGTQEVDDIRERLAGRAKSSKGLSIGIFKVLNCHLTNGEHRSEDK
jgi:hypothetical protein